MALNIKNERVVELAARVAERTGVGKTTAVEDALERRLAELDRKESSEAARKTEIHRLLHEIWAETGTRGELRQLGDQELYDESGLYHEALVGSEASAR